MKKRILLLCSVMVIAGSLLTGCSEKNAADADSTETENTESVKTEIAKGLLFDLPKGFEADETTPGLYLPKSKEDGDFSCIYYQEAPYDERFALLTEDTIAELMEEIYSEMYGIETEVAVNDFYRFSLDGYTAYKIETEFTKDENIVNMTEYVVESGQTCLSVTYLLKKGSNWENAFKDSAKTLKVKE